MTRRFFAAFPLGFAEACRGVQATREKAPTGRWNLTVTPDGPSYSAWLELSPAAGKPKLRLVGRVGAVKPIPQFDVSDNRLRFTTKDWFGRYETLSYDLVFRSEGITGVATRESGAVMRIQGVPAPVLARPEPRCWSNSIALFNGTDLHGWMPKMPARARWKASGGVLVNFEKGTNLISEQQFEDFQLHIEFRIPRAGNSGVFLRGRYEIQIEDEEATAARDPVFHLGAIYGYLGPRVRLPRQPGEWQSFDATLVGRVVTLAQNGVVLIDRQEIPGPTGGAVDSQEADPGPLMLQWDHGPVEFRNILVRRAIS